MPYNKVEDDELGRGKRTKGSAMSKKLDLDRNDKKEYPLQYRLLKFYVSKGAKDT